MRIVAPARDRFLTTGKISGEMQGRN